MSLRSVWQGTILVAGDGTSTTFKFDLRGDPIGGPAGFPFPSSSPADAIVTGVSGPTTPTATASLSTNGRFLTLMFSSALNNFTSNSDLYSVSIDLLYPGS